MLEPTDDQIQAWADEAEYGYDFTDELLVKRLDPRATIPTKGTQDAAAYDLYSIEGNTVYVGYSRAFGTGIAIAIPTGYCGLVLPRSGLACKRGLTVANSPGLIDSDYRGEVVVYLRNESDIPQAISAGDRIAQLLIVAVPFFRLRETALELPVTERGAGGFGSTGS